MHCHRGMKVQSLLFDNRLWTIDMACHWLRSHGFRYAEIDVGVRYYRFRQDDPKLFDKQLFRMKTVGRGVGGVKAVLVAKEFPS